MYFHIFDGDLNQALVAVIDGRTIASGDVVKESRPLRVTLGNFSCNVAFNIISSPEHLVVLGMPWFELNNPMVDWRRRSFTKTKSRTKPQAQGSKPPTLKIATISLEEFVEEGRQDPFSVFAVMAHPAMTPTPPNPSASRLPRNNETSSLPQYVPPRPFALQHHPIKPPRSSESTKPASSPQR